MTAHGLIIAAPRSGSGKTTITLGLQRALVRRGLTVRGLKCGPDYIDPAFHAAATGAPSANLDSFAMPPALLRQIAGDATRDSDLIVAEGSMGLFDGVPGAEGRTGASADIAALLGWPIVLVIDVSGQAQSAAAIALGCMHYDPRITIAGVILNKVASERHSRLVGQGMARIGLPVLGALPREASLILPERHLGLVQAGETQDLEARLEALADAVTAAVDLDALVAAVSKDIRARPVLDEWLRLGVARLTDQDEVVLNAAAFVPQEGFEEKLSYLALHVGDHAMAAVENTLGRSDPWFERSVHYRGLSGADVEVLRARASELGMKALQTLNGEVKDEVSVADADAVNRRFTFGVYFYADDDERSEETS